MTDVTKYHTWRETMQQPKAWQDWFTQCDIIALREWIKEQDFDDVWFCGAGTSAYIGDILTAGAIGWDGPKFRSVPTTDLVASPHAYLKNARPLVVNFGRSGDSTETIGTLDALDRLAPSAPRINITCNANSALARRPSAGPSKTIILPDETHDLGFAMTSSFSTMLLTALAIFDADTDYHNHVTKLVETFNLMLPQFIEISKITPARIVYIGTGPLGFAAREAALKSLELTAGQIPSMWETTLGFRHGPKSFVCPETMIVLFKTPAGHCRAYEDDLFSEIKIQFPNNPLFEIDLAKTPCAALTENTAWLAPIMILLAQVQSVHWSNGLGLNVDNPFDGRGTLSRVVSGVRLHEVQQWSQ